MAHKSDLLTTGRRLNDLALALVESVHEAGGDDDDARRVFSDPELRKQLGQLVMMRRLAGKKFPSDINVPKLIPEGQVVIRDVEPSKFRVSNLEFVSFLSGDKQSVSAEEMCQRAVTLRGNFGLCDAKRLLVHQNQIPEDLRRKHIILPGTVLVEFIGSVNERVPLLMCVNGRWFLNFILINGAYNNDYRLARIKQAAQAEEVTR